MDTKPPVDERSQRARRGIFVVLEQAGIKSRNDRLELASDVLDKRIDSFTELNKDDLLDLHFALQSWKKIQDVRSANGSLLEEAEGLVEGMHEIDISDVVKKKAENLPYQTGFDDEKSY